MIRRPGGDEFLAGFDVDMAALGQAVRTQELKAEKEEEYVPDGGGGPASAGLEIQEHIDVSQSGATIHEGRE